MVEQLKAELGGLRYDLEQLEGKAEAPARAKGTDVSDTGTKRRCGPLSNAEHAAIEQKVRRAQAQLSASRPGGNGTVPVAAAPDRLPAGITAIPRKSMAGGEKWDLRYAGKDYTVWEQAVRDRPLGPWRVKGAREWGEFPTLAAAIKTFHEYAAAGWGACPLGSARSAAASSAHPAPELPYNPTLAHQLYNLNEERERLLATINRPDGSDAVKRRAVQRLEVVDHAIDKLEEQHAARRVAALARAAKEVARAE
jgi:hypothetical protein